MSISAKHLAYAPIPLQGADDDGGDEGGLESPQHAALPQPHLRQYRRSSSLLARIVAGCVVVCICLLALVSSLIAWNFLGSLETKVNRYVASHRPVAPAEVCQSPVQRPSWNRLSRDARRAYIDAVLCLTKRPSRIFEQSSAYDDFTYMHIMYGNLMHQAAGNLPWHRLHLAIWEQTLRRECGYGGQLPYWEWDAESEAVWNSPIFDNDVGFGGDGDQSQGHLAPEDAFTLDVTRCVTTGPFTQVRPVWFAELPKHMQADLQYVPHCITRAYSDALSHAPSGGSNITDIDFSHRAVQQLLETANYAEFNLQLEDMHDWVPRSIRGDFASLAAPNDPIFHLHLANIDRIWWLWQHVNEGKHMLDYSGDAVRSMNVSAALDDPLPFAAYPGISGSVSAHDVMDTESGFLGMCYRY